MLELEQLASKPKEFIGTTGINYTTFQILLGKVEAYEDEQKAAKPISKRGRKSRYALANVLLLTLVYLRQYGTFLNLGHQFGMSESYAQKRYVYMRTILLQVLAMPEASLLTTQHFCSGRCKRTTHRTSSTQAKGVLFG